MPCMGQLREVEGLFEVFNGITGTFNWLYVDSENIAYFNSSLLPIRADGIPHEREPRDDAPGFRFHDRTVGLEKRFAFGPVG